MNRNPLINVYVSQTPESLELGLPEYQTPGAAGLDLQATTEHVIEPGTTALVKTGLTVAIPDGYEIQIRPRSGLANKNSVTVLNTPGTIDSDYRGEIGVILINHGKSNYEVKKGARIAQAVLCPVAQAFLVPVSFDQMETTKRGTGGFGSSGV